MRDSSLTQNGFKEFSLETVVACFEQHANNDAQLSGKKCQKTSTLETGLSKEIKLLAEIEKIWIIHNIEPDGQIDRSSIKNYLKQMSLPKI